MSRLTLAVAVLLWLPSDVRGQQLTVVGHNVESGDASPQWIGTEIIARIDAHVWGFSEVFNESWAAAFEEAAEDAHRREFTVVLGTTGADDRLLVLYDDDLLDNVASVQLHHINVGGNGRAPLVVHFRITATGREFLFMVNHLFRGNSAARHQQASLLNAWAQQQTLPVVAVGDYNFDWNLPKGEKDHDLGFDKMVEGNRFAWVRPAKLIKTQCSTNFNSVLDFVFVSGEAQTWKAVSTIERPEEAFCNDDAQRPDHRPVTARFTVPGVLTTDAILADALAHLRQLGDEVQSQVTALSALPTLNADQQQALKRLQALLEQLRTAEKNLVL
jgi:hypothetical protein